jgi:hypothetical protein
MGPEALRPDGCWRLLLAGDGTAKDEDTGIRILLPLANAGIAHAPTLVGPCHYNVSGPLPIYSARTLS